MDFPIEMANISTLMEAWEGGLNQDIRREIGRLAAISRRSHLGT